MDKLISCKNLYWRSDTADPPEILSDIALELGKNEMIVIRGSGGSGKSSLLRILAGEERHSSGKLLYSGEEYTGKSGVRTRSSVLDLGYISEESPFISSEDMQKNIDFVLKLRGVPDSSRFDRNMEILQKTGLIDKRKMPVKMLSMTEKKLFSLAVMLARGCGIYLCDLNLTGFSDEENMINLLKDETHRGAGVIVTARSDAEIKGARVKNIDIKDGKII